MATRVTAQEWAKDNIRVNAVAPGLVRTRFSQALWDNPQILGDTLNRTPMGRIAEPEEIVGTMLYLASDAGRYVTGTVARVDGGEAI